MIFQHQTIANRWANFNLYEQMANVGSEVERAINWKNKGDDDYSEKAAERALELLYFTINEYENYSQLKELTRLYEVLVDYFYGENIYASSAKLWQNYFRPFNYAAQAKK
jgi:hypothetical protein